MFNSNVLVKVNTFNSGRTDINGKDPVILQPIAGKSPNRMVLAGTIAETAGFEVGKTYLANVRETESNEYGRQFRWSVIAEAAGFNDILDAQERLGSPVVFDVDAKVEEAQPVAEQKAGQVA